MLQQTQVERVIPYYQKWLSRFPNVRTLAQASLAQVLEAWQGLGYNRRAKHLHEAAKAIAAFRRFPRAPEELEKLPGIGPYTARAVAAFAHNENVVFIETNIRTALTHHFFPKRKVIRDTELLALLTLALPKGKSREWYAALMDYGSHLKRSGVRVNAKAKGYRAQAAFVGSTRQARGALLKALLKGPKRAASLMGILGEERKEQVERGLAALLTEGMVISRGGRFHLPD
jgi:A/G-specific adenine glycosylase